MFLLLSLISYHPWTLPPPHKNFLYTRTDKIPLWRRQYIYIYQIVYTKNISNGVPLSIHVLGLHDYTTRTYYRLIAVSSIIQFLTFFVNAHHCIIITITAPTPTILSNNNGKNNTESQPVLYCVHGDRRVDQRK